MRQQKIFLDFEFSRNLFPRIYPHISLPGWCFIFCMALLPVDAATAGGAVATATVTAAADVVPWQLPASVGVEQFVVILRSLPVMGMSFRAVVCYCYTIENMRDVGSLLRYSTQRDAFNIVHWLWEFHSSRGAQIAWFSCTLIVIVRRVVGIVAKGGSHSSYTLRDLRQL